MSNGKNDVLLEHTCAFTSGKLQVNIQLMMVDIKGKYVDSHIQFWLLSQVVWVELLQNTIF